MAGLKASVERLQEVRGWLSGVLDKADKQEWRALLREFHFKEVLQQDPPHILRVSLDVEPTPFAVLQPSYKPIRRRTSGQGAG